MHYDASKTKSLLGISDLTLAASIKAGLSAALDVRSYESRLRILLATLSAARSSSKEARLTPLIDDAVDNIRALHSFRLAIVGEQQPKQLVLAVTFDGGWEPYMRRIWRDLGPLLDVIFCNCQGYLPACSHTFAEYSAWVRSAQVDTEFFYNASPLTVSDLHYLRGKEQERLQGTSQAQMNFPPAPAQLLDQALPALTALYRLTEMYLPDPIKTRQDDDAQILLRATDQLLGRASSVLQAVNPDAPGRTPTETAALRWFAGAAVPKAPSLPQDTFMPDKVQGGIVEQYADITHGCLLLVGLKDAVAALALLSYLRDKVTKASRQGQGIPMPCINIAFTLQGLSVAGVPRATLEQLPEEFRQGMAARASVLGDYDYNHPTRWALPERNWPPATGPARVELSSVHVIVQFAITDFKATAWNGVIDNTHPLYQPVTALDQALSGSGVRILSVQVMQRFISKKGQEPRAHFGFVDGRSQPSPGGVPPQAPGYSDYVPLGDVLLGYENSRHDAPCKGRLWDDGSFLVVRKLQQDVDALEDLARQCVPLSADHVKAQLMGRKLDGVNLIDGTKGNSFDYAGDASGAKCPLQSHVRRANPRTRAGDRPDQVDVPRIIRRGMSYGPPHAQQPQAERGLVFMAYNASIAEQFELVQAWLSGGNSSAQSTYSSLRDPFLGVPVSGDPNCFVFDQGRQVLALDPARPLVKLQWGLYAFVPSIKALVELEDLAREAAELEHETPSCPHHKKANNDERARARSALAMKGAMAIGSLEMGERQFGVDFAKTQWKIALEDFSARMSGTSRAIWAAVRELHGGVMRTPYGVLVCNQKRVGEVYANASGRYSVTGYAERLKQAIGDIYLGMDASDSRYRAQSEAVNTAIFEVSERDGFDSARTSMISTVQRFLPTAPATEATVEVKDLVELALADCCAKWFGIPDGNFVKRGGWSWGANPPATCPGHFHSPSRYTFQPRPGPEATALGTKHGQDLQDAVSQLVNNAAGLVVIQATALGGAIVAAAAGNTQLLVNNLIGAMMGMLPTVDGNLRSTLYEWLKDGSLWDHQLAYLAATGTPEARARKALLKPLSRTMRLRPVPELVWRTAVEPHKLGSLDVKAGDTIVVSIVSAGQEHLLMDDAKEEDLYPIFGGQRTAGHAPVGEPLHACPGQKMAMGLLLGMLAGLMESATLRPTLSPTTLKLGPPFR